MSFLNTIFGSDSDQGQPNVDWVQITSLAQVDEIVSLSYDLPIAIFKHSTRCGISRMVLKKFENDFDRATKVTMYFLDLLAYRDISNAISEKFAITHQSPQLLLIKEGKAVYDASHSDIEAAILVDKA